MRTPVRIAFAFLLCAVAAGIEAGHCSSESLPTTSGGTALSGGTAIPSTYFGMHVQSTNPSHWPAEPVGALGKGVGTAWIYLEPQRDVFDWHMLDQWINIAKAHHIQLFWSNSGIPPWAAADPGTCHPSYSGSSVQKCTSMVSNIQYWNDFITAMATRYKGKGLIYELWNEPDTTAFTGTVQQMAQLATSAYNIIRSIDPAATILAPSCDPPYMDKLLAAGLPTGIDVISFHSYFRSANDLVDAASAMRKVMSKHRLEAKPIWVTEAAWDDQVPQSQRGGLMAQAYILGWSAGISRLYWYAWDNDTHGTLWQQRELREGKVYGEVSRWLTGAKLDSGCARDPAGIWRCPITRDGKRQLMIWSESRQMLSVSADFSTFTDMSGTNHAANAGLTVSQEPVLLEGSH